MVKRSRPHNTPQPTRPRTRHRYLVVAGLLAPMALGVAFFSGQPKVQAQTEIKVMVTIYKVWERGCYGEDTFLGCVGGEDADFYSVTDIAGQRVETAQFEDQSSIEPGWQSTKVVAQDSLVPVRIEMWDDDGGLRGDDDHVDLTGGDGRDLNLTVVVGKDPGSCRVGGNFPGATASCGQRLSDGGNNDEDSAGIEFSVDVVYPTRVGQTTVMCTHSPLWPQPGQSVTINAVAMEIQTGTTGGGFGLPHSYTFNPVPASKIQIWLNANGAAPNRTMVQECLNPGVAGCTASNVNPTGTTFQYGCWVERPGVTVASNYREVSVGAPPGANIVPVLYNQPKERAIDIVLHADLNYPNGWLDAQFIADASAMVNGALAEPIWVQYQSRMNIWISQRAGNPTWPATGTGSTTVSSQGLQDGNGPEPFAEASGVVHRRTIANAAPPPATFPTRDGAGGGFFTVNALVGSAPNVMRHEMGHAAFGLADEYCCDGGYWQADKVPDVYSSQLNCTNDFGDLDKINLELKWPLQSGCRSIPQATINPATATATPGAIPTPMWWVADPSAFQSGAATLQDLMVGNDFGTTSDIRRFRWVLDALCPQGGC